MAGSTLVEALCLLGTPFSMLVDFSEMARGLCTFSAPGPGALVLNWQSLFEGQQGSMDSGIQGFPNLSISVLTSFGIRLYHWPARPPQSLRSKLRILVHPVSLLKSKQTMHRAPRWTK